MRRTSRAIEFWNARRHDLGAFAFIAVFFMVFFRLALFTGKFFVTADSFVYCYPLRTVVWDQLRHGKLPLWTNQIMSGYPLLSMAHIGIGYPLTWLYAILPGRFAEAIYVMAPSVLFPFFIYCYLREVGRSQLASILAGLTFGYGGFMISQVAYNGLIANALMWLPLMLIACERARTRPFIRCLLGSTAAYSMAVLSGVGQGFLLAGTVAVLYSGFIVIFQETSGPLLPYSRPRRWQPLVVTLGSILLSAGVAAFQILETLRAQRRSIRSHLSYDIFAFGSYTPGQAVKAVLGPLYYHLEASGYVAPLALMLALIAIVAVVRRRNPDQRLYFWLGLSVIGYVFILGENTPAFALLHHLPLFKLFRGAARHAFELTLGLSMLAAYGWDAVIGFAAGRQRDGISERVSARATVFTVAALGLALLVGWFWMRNIARIPLGQREFYYYPPDIGFGWYAIWKVLFSALLVLAAWQAWRMRRSGLRVAAMLALIGMACFFEPSIMAARWWWPTLKPASRFTTPTPTTEFLQKYSPNDRVYTHAVLFVEEYEAQPHLDPANLTMLYGLQDVGGYEPLILGRYSRALGDAYMDAVVSRPGYPPDKTRFLPSSHVLDLLNTRFVVSYPYLEKDPPSPSEQGHPGFNPRDLDINVSPGQSVTIEGAPYDADSVALVTATAFSANETDGTAVARVRIFISGGKVVERVLRIGIDTAEWAHERPDVRPIVRHSMAHVFEQWNETNNPGPKFNFIAQLDLGERSRVDHLEITNVTQSVVLVMHKASVFDSRTGLSTPLPPVYDSDKWKLVYDDGHAQILRNERALPRAWMVAEAEAVDGEDALRRIRGETPGFDPRHTALLEVTSESLPALPGGVISPNSSARIVEYENNRLAIETSADTASILVVSEINYPGWVATVDGKSTPIYTADFLLRGIALPAGAHRVEMRYTAPAARNGAMISGLTLLLIGALILYERRRPQITDRRNAA